MALLNKKYFLGFSLICLSYCLDNGPTSQPTTVVLAFSGLTWDCMEKFSLPSFQTIKANGVFVEQKIDPFQTESLPSFITMATGQYPETHGILSNNMLDVNKGRKFRLGDTDSFWWDNVKPFWIENQMNGNRSALCYWPGHNVLFNGTKANLTCNSKKYFDPISKIDLNKFSRHTMPFSERLQTVKRWLAMNSTLKPNFIGVYFEEPMISIQKYGYESVEVSKAFRSVNNITQTMLNHLSKYKDVNLIVIGESGMTQLDDNKQIYLEDYIDKKYLKFDVIDDGPIMSLHPYKKQLESKLYDTLRHANKHMTVYTQNNLTKDMHFRFPGRTCPIYVSADEHWHIYRDRVADRKKAMMGFDGKFESTHSLFLGIGPNFKKSVELRAMGNKDIYYILQRLLGFNSSNKTLVNEELLEKLLLRTELKWYHKIATKIAKKVTSSTLNMTFAIIFAVVIFFTIVYLIIASIFKCADVCNCYGKTVKLNISPNKILKARSSKDSGHLLSEEEISSAESDTDNELKEFRSSRK